MVGRTAKFDAGSAFSYDLLFERLHQPRLANAGLATEQDDLPFAAFRLCPPLAQQANFQISADQRRQSCIDRDLKTALRCTLPQDSVHGDGGEKALYFLGTQVLTGKQSLYEPLRGGTDHQRIG